MPVYSPAPVWSDRHRDILARSEFAFQKQSILLPFWQEIADNFYPERAHFTMSDRAPGNFADGLSTSYPLIVRRDLGDTFASQLRPEGVEWGEVKTNRPDEAIDETGRKYLQMMSKIERKAMYDKSAQFNRATKQADHDYAAFGNSVISCEVNLKAVSLLYRNWHLRDMAWLENAEGQICFITRKWDPTAIDLYKRFGPDGVHPNVKKMVEEDGGRNAYKCVPVRHIMIMSDDYAPSQPGPAGKWTQPWVSIYLDTENHHPLEEVGKSTSYYIIMRWQTVSGSPYAFSPAVTCGLPDGRLLQAQAYTLLRAGQMAVDPPRIAVGEAFRGDLSLFPGSVSWVDYEYDGKLEEVLRTIGAEKNQFPVGFSINERTEAMLREAFYLNKLVLPQRGPEMTAEEARFRVQEYVRQASPLFAPMIDDCNGQIWDHTFVNLRGVNAFGPPEAVPDSLKGAQVDYKFVSPLLQSQEQELPRIYLDSLQLCEAARPYDPAAPKMLNPQKALRAALRGRGTPADWMVDEDDMEELSAQMAQQQAVEAAAGQVAGAAGVAQQVGEAGKSLAEAGAAAEQPDQAAAA